MRIARLLAVPVVIATMLLLAAPAFATEAPKPTVVLTVQVDCTQSGSFCFDFRSTTTNIPAEGRNVVVTVFGVQQNGQAQALGDGQTVHFGQNVADHAFAFCFPVPTGVTFAGFTVQVKLVEPDLSVTLNGSSDLHILPPSAGGGVAVLASLDNTCTTAASGGTASAAHQNQPAGTSLASTGGFDPRVLAVGVVLLLMGLGLHLVSRWRTTGQ